MERRAVLSDMIDRYGSGLADHPLTRAWSEGACVMLNCFTSHLAHKKSVFALTADPFLRQSLSQQEADAIDRHLPWTRLLQPGPTTYRGQRIDLIDFARAHRDTLLIKPNDAYGGHGIICGWEVDEQTWHTALKQATTHPHVIQERIALPTAPYPFWDGQRTHIDRYQHGLDPCLIDSTAHGCMCRLAQGPLINVTTGGGAVPVFQLSAGG